MIEDQIWLNKGELMRNNDLIINKITTITKNNKMTKVTYLTIYRNKCENYKVSYWHMSFHAAVPG